MKNDRVLLAHGSGGKLMHDLIEKYFISSFDNEILSALDDAASFRLESGEVAFTTDSYVVSPYFFPGGDIGRLAVCGTVNDLSMKGASPKFLSAAFIIEEGFFISDLEIIIKSMVKAAKEAGVSIVTGDTKVVERGSADGLFINTAGIGVIPPGVNISGHNLKAGDKVILSGSIGDHGVAIICAREGINFESSLLSDAAPLNKMISEALSVCPGIHAMRDPTRGGLSSTLNEFAVSSGVSILIDESQVPIKPEVRGACELLGFDPFQVANEGKAVVVAPPADAEKTVEAMKKHEYGRDAAIIGEVKQDSPGKVFLKTPIGTTRILDLLVGEQLPRIC